MIESTPMKNATYNHSHGVSILFYQNGEWLKPQYPPFSVQVPSGSDWYHDTFPAWFYICENLNRNDQNKRSF